MPYVDIKRLKTDSMTPEEVGAMELDVQIAVKSVWALGIEDSSKVLVSIVQEVSRPGDWYKEPTIEFVFAQGDPEVRTPEVMREAVNLAAAAVYHHMHGRGVELVRGTFRPYDEKQQYVKCEPEVA